MRPVIALIGRVNVGKSTLFNRLTHTKQALVADLPGLTRDRQYGYCHYEDQSFIVIDTGGLSDQPDEMDTHIAEQCQKAIDAADIILFLVDAKTGVLPEDQWIANKLRRSNLPVFLIANKIDGTNQMIATTEFYTLGLGNPIPIAAIRNEGIQTLLRQITASLPKTAPQEQDIQGVKIAIVGKPNVGKSTLINKILGEERVIVSDLPGTTRDSIFISLKYHNKPYTLIDTAGIRRRGKTNKMGDKIEKFSIVKTLQAIDICNVVVFLIDAQIGITDQDLKLLGLILDSGKALVVAINKWDNLPLDKQRYVKKELDRRFEFLSFVKQHFISAKQGTGVHRLFYSIDHAYASATQELSTPKLTRILEQLVENHEPPLVKGRRIKLRYAHPGGYNPPVIVIHGNQIKSLPASYKRYLEKGFRKALNLIGTPIRIELRAGENPYIK